MLRGRARILRVQCNETQAHLARILRAQCNETQAHLGGCSSCITQLLGPQWLQHASVSGHCIVIQALFGSRHVASPHVVGSGIDCKTERDIPQPLSLNLSMLLIK